jgi:hypothetical protein
MKPFDDVDADENKKLLIFFSLFIRNSSPFSSTKLYSNLLATHSCGPIQKKFMNECERHGQELIFYVSFRVLATAS